MFGYKMKLRREKEIYEKYRRFKVLVTLKEIEERDVFDFSKVNEMLI